MRCGRLLIGALLVGSAGMVLGSAAGSSGQAQEATPAPARWHVHLVDLSEGNSYLDETEALINAELAALEQSCIDGVDFFAFGRNQTPSVAIVLHC